METSLLASRLMVGRQLTVMVNPSISSRHCDDAAPRCVWLWGEFGDIGLIQAEPIHSTLER